MKLAATLIIGATLLIDAYPFVAVLAVVLAYAVAWALDTGLFLPVARAYEVKRATQLRYVPAVPDDETLAVPAYWRRAR